MIRVIVVDDHAMVRVGLERLLASTPDLQVVASVTSGDEAIALVDADPPDVVLLDMAMPGLGGIETARRIATAHPAVKILMLSTFDEPRDVSSALAAGAHGYLVKDVEPEVLIAGIRSLRDGGAPLSPSVAAGLIRAASRQAPAAPALTGREEDVLRLIVEGLSNKEIASRLGIGEKTVKTYCGRMFRRLGVGDRTKAAVWAERNLPPRDGPH